MDTIYFLEVHFEEWKVESQKVDFEKQKVEIYLFTFFNFKYKKQIKLDTCSFYLLLSRKQKVDFGKQKVKSKFRKVESRKLESRFPKVESRFRKIESRKLETRFRKIEIRKWKVESEIFFDADGI